MANLSTFIIPNQAFSQLLSGFGMQSQKIATNVREVCASFSGGFGNE